MEPTILKNLPFYSHNQLSGCETSTDAFPAEPVLSATEPTAGGAGGKRETLKDSGGETGKSPSSSPQPLSTSGDQPENRSDEEKAQEENQDDLPGMKENDGYFKSDMKTDTGTGNV
jgi:hypothetical protein